MESRDLVIIGGGPGGYTCAIRASQLGRKVTLVEREALGGVCLNWGCIPTKSLLRHAKLVDDIQKASIFGVDIKGYEINFEKIISNSREVASKLENGVKYLMKKNNVEVLYGTARFSGVDSVTIESQGSRKQISFKNAVIAVGARPRSLPNLDIDGEIVHNYRSILVNKKLPKSLFVIGGGAIGLEFSYFFASLGVRVTLVEALDRIAPMEDKDVSAALKKSLENHGVKILNSAKVEKVDQKGNGAEATVLTAEGKSEQVQADMVLVAIGVQPNTESLDLEKAGILTNNGFIAVNERYQTTCSGVYAIGDCIGGPLLAHKASHEAVIVGNILGGKEVSALDREKIPSCIYTEPQVASIGLTEEQARAKGLSVKVFKLPLSAIGKAVAMFETDGFCKVVIDDRYNELLGVHMIGPEVTEIISSASLAKSHEAVAESILDTVFPHPTLSEALLEAVAAAIGSPLNF